MEYGLNEQKTFNFHNACCGGGTFMGVDGQESSEQIADETANAEVIKPTTVSGNFLTKSVMLNIPVWMLLVGVGVIGYKMFYKKA